MLNPRPLTNVADITDNEETLTQSFFNSTSFQQPKTNDYYSVLKFVLNNNNYSTTSREDYKRNIYRPGKKRTSRKQSLKRGL